MSQIKNNQHDFLYGYLFHYNAFNGFWYCFPREAYQDYFNGVKNKSIIHNENIEPLIEYIKIKKNESIKKL